MDSLSLGDYIPNNTIVQKSLAFDEYNNRKDGVNFNVTYMALDDNMEDSIIFSDVAAGKLTSPLIKPVQIMINDNDIPLNLYGDSKLYKIIPDIGEEIVDANLIGLRKEKKEESYYTQSVDNLRKPIMSDDMKQVHGRVIDIDIYCNNPEILDSHYYAQLKMYYQELQRMSNEIVSTLLPYASQNFEMSYDLQKLFANAKRVCNGDQYIDKRPFSNIIMNITVLEEKQMEAGDKASNRYGGKGVISNIWEQKYMPRFKNSKGEYEYVDIIFNSSTMINRENVGQSFELSLTHIGNEILARIVRDKLSVNEAYNMIKTYISFCSPEQAIYLEERKNMMTIDELMFFIESIIESGSIHLSMKPISDTMTIDKLLQLYEAFPWVEQNEIEVALVGSDGNIRYVPARRKVVVGKQYIFRLKQFAEEKFSATSLSATNIRNENTKSRAKKDFRELYPNTPIRFGNMETNNMNHLGADVVIANMMIHSVSPQGRRLVEQMYTGDPFKIDIKLDSDSKNRSAEIANTYLKTIGRRLKFIKVRKQKTKIAISPILFTKDPVVYPISFVPENMRDGFDYEKDFKERQELEKSKIKTKAICPIEFEGITRKTYNDRAKE
jgi:DNA-directed RNA polymerase beta subunit